MTPGNAARILRKRRNWLAVTLEGYDIDERIRDRCELAAIDFVLRMFLPSTISEEHAREVQQHQLEQARAIQAERASRCTCERCPVHGGTK